MDCVCGDCGDGLLPDGDWTKSANDSLQLEFSDSFDKCSDRSLSQNDSRATTFENPMRDEHLNQKLISAVWAGDTASVVQLLAEGACPDAAGVISVPVLAIASQNGYEDIVAALLAAGAGVHFQRVWGGDTALSRAINGNHAGIVQRLLNANADVNEQDQYGFRPLIIAAQNNQPQLIRLLLEAGADVNGANFHQDTALTFAAWSGFTAIVEMLLAVDGVDIDHVDGDGDTALLCAADESRGDVIEILRRAGANVHHVNYSGETALIRASRKGNIDIVESLLALGAAVDHADVDGMTALCYASESGSAAVVERLLITGDVPIDYANAQGETALILAARRGHTQVLEVLLSHGANVNHASANGTTALIEACDLGHLQVVGHLLEAGANADSEDLHGFTALLRAAQIGKLDVLEMLLARGAVDINHTNGDGSSAFVLAARLGHDSVVVKLLSLGVDRAADSWICTKLPAVTEPSSR